MSQSNLDTLNLVDKAGITHTISTKPLKEDIIELQTNKQDILIAGKNVTIVDNTISVESTESREFVIIETSKDKNNIANTVSLSSDGASFNIQQTKVLDNEGTLQTLPTQTIDKNLQHVDSYIVYNNDTAVYDIIDVNTLGNIYIDNSVRPVVFKSQEESEGVIVVLPQYTTPPVAKVTEKNSVINILNYEAYSNLQLFTYSDLQELNSKLSEDFVSISEYDTFKDNISYFEESIPDWNNPILDVDSINPKFYITDITGPYADTVINAFDGNTETFLNCGTNGDITEFTLNIVDRIILDNIKVTCIDNYHQDTNYADIVITDVTTGLEIISFQNHERDITTNVNISEYEYTNSLKFKITSASATHRITEIAMHGSGIYVTLSDYVTKSSNKLELDTLSSKMMYNNFHILETPLDSSYNPVTIEVEDDLSITIKQTTVVDNKGSIVNLPSGSISVDTYTTDEGYITYGPDGYTILNTKKDTVGVEYTTPELTANGTAYTDEYAVSADTGSISNAWAITTKELSIYVDGGMYILNDTGSVLFYFNKGYKLKDIVMTNAAQNGIGHGSFSGKIYGSKDEGTTWVELATYTNSNNTQSSSYTILVDSEEFYTTYRLQSLSSSHGFTYIGHALLNGYKISSDYYEIDGSSNPICYKHVLSGRIPEKVTDFIYPPLGYIRFDSGEPVIENYQANTVTHLYTESDKNIIKNIIASQTESETESVPFTIISKNNDVITIDTSNTTVNIEQMTVFDNIGVKQTLPSGSINYTSLENKYKYYILYNNETEKYEFRALDILIDSVYETPILSSNGVPYVDNYAIAASSEYSSVYLAYKLTTGTVTGETDAWSTTINPVINESNPAYIYMYFNKPFKMTSIDFQNRNNTVITPITEFTLQGTKDSVVGSETWVDIESYTNSIISNSTIWSVDVDVNNQDTYYGYRLKITKSVLSNQCDMGNITAVGNVLLSEHTVINNTERPIIYENSMGDVSTTLPQYTTPPVAIVDKLESSLNVLNYDSYSVFNTFTNSDKREIINLINDNSSLEELDSIKNQIDVLYNDINGGDVIWIQPTLDDTLESSQMSVTSSPTIGELYKLFDKDEDTYVSLNKASSSWDVDMTFSEEVKVRKIYISGPLVPSIATPLTKIEVIDVVTNTTLSTEENTTSEIGGTYIVTIDNPTIYSKILRVRLFTNSTANTYPTRVRSINVDGFYRDSGVIYNVDNLIKDVDILEENTTIVEHTYEYSEFVQPVMTDVGNPYIDPFAVQVLSEYSGDYKAYKMVDSVKSGGTSYDAWLSTQGVFPQYVTLCFKDDINITNISIVNRNSPYTHAIKNYRVTINRSSDEVLLVTDVNSNLSANSEWSISLEDNTHYAKEYTIYIDSSSTDIAGIQHIEITGMSRTLIKTDVYSVKDKLSEKQNKLKTGTNISIDESTDTISVAGGGVQYEFPLGYEYITRTTNVPIGCIYIDDGSVYTEAMFPQFFELLENGGLPTIPLDTWVEDSEGYCSYYGIDTVARTFRVPKKHKFVGGGATQETIGTVIEAGVPNITAYGQIPGVNFDGAFYNSGHFGGIANGSEQFVSTGFDASRANPTYGKSNTVTPTHDTGRWVVVAYNEATPISTAQVQEFVQALDSKANKSEVGYRVIYGTGQKVVYDPDNPNAVEDDALGTNGIITYGPRYVLANPFGTGTQTILKLEILVNGEWGEPHYYCIYAGNLQYTYGAVPSNYQDGIVVQTGASGLMREQRTLSLNPFDIGTDTHTESAQCRIHVWRIGA